MRRRKFVLSVISLGTIHLLSTLWFFAENYDVNETKRKVSDVMNQEIYTFYSNDQTFKTNHQVDTLYKACRYLGFVEDLNTTNIRAHMSPNLKLLYCRVNKCASTMTLELLRKLFDCDTECLIKVAERARLNVSARQIMNDAFSFMIVREPYGRLFSTYCNIFYFPKEDWLYRATKIIKLTRSNISDQSIKYGHDLTFAELIKYTVETFELGNHLDEHVRPMHHKSCNPCVFKFDFIAHLETLENDLNGIFHKLRRKNVIDNFPTDIIVSLKNWTTFGPIKHLFRTIPLLKESNIPLYNVFVRAWCYYQITGYVLSTIDFPFDKRDVLKISKENFLKELKNAMAISMVYKTRLKEQKHEAFMQAYSTISSDYMDRLSKVVMGDCILFGYEVKPTHLFGKMRKSKNNSDFNYFKGI